MLKTRFLECVVLDISGASCFFQFLHCFFDFCKWSPSFTSKYWLSQMHLWHDHMSCQHKLVNYYIKVYIFRTKYHTIRASCSKDFWFLISSTTLLPFALWKILQAVHFDKIIIFSLLVFEASWVFHRSQSFCRALLSYHFQFHLSISLSTFKLSFILMLSFSLR